MQETKYTDALDNIAKRKQEIFVAKEATALLIEMQERLEDLQAQGHELVRREKITHRQALRVAIDQALHGNSRLLTKFKQPQSYRGGHR